MDQKRIKVLLVGPQKAIGGHATYINDLLKARFERIEWIGFDTTGKREFKLKRKSLSETVDLWGNDFKLLFKSVLFSFGRLLRFIRTIFSCHSDRVLIAGSSNLLFEQSLYVFIACILRKKVFLHFHGPLDLAFAHSGPLKKKMMFFVYGSLTKFLVLSKKDFDIARKGIGESRVEVVTNYIFPDSIEKSRPIRPSDSDGLVRVFFMGGGNPVRKGVSDIISAINRLYAGKNNVPEMRFFFAGSELIKELLDKNLCPEAVGRVEYLGWITEDAKLKLLREADIMTLPSYDEGLPFGLMEAMAKGMAIVASDVGGIPELIPSQEHGLILPPGDVDALALAYQRLASDKDLRTRQGQKNIERIRTYYLSDNIFHKIESIIVDNV